MLTALSGEAPQLRLPEVVAVCCDPVLVITKHVTGSRLSDEMVNTVGPAGVDRIGRELASFLAALHRPEVLATIEAVTGPLPSPAAPPATTEILRSRFGRWAGPDQRGWITAWCDWATDVLASPGPAVPVHGDFHGYNQLWDRDRLDLRLVTDFETVGTADPEYDLRYLPATGPGVALAAATMTHYQREAGRPLSVERVMAWHVRTMLGDALWRCEAGVSLPDGRTASDWVDDLARRLDALGIKTK